MATAAEWWVWYNPLDGKPAQVIQAATSADVKNKTGFAPLAGPFGTEADATAYIKAQLGSTTSGHVTNALSGVDAIGSFFDKLGDANTWIRVAKVVVGGLLLIVGLVHITGAAGAAANVARKVPLPI